ncbi:MAG: hypothetical protein LBL20_04140, partial [Treponema sp.]|nr:hypothetical protein [Treponema sp.]
MPKFNWRVFLPAAALALVLLLHTALPPYEGYRVKLLPYFTNFLYILTGLFTARGVLSIFNGKERKKLAFKAPFYAAGFLFLGLYNIITIKINLIPGLYFPAPERIIGVFIEDWFFILRCLVYSLRLLLSGFFIGAFLGVATGTLIGWSQRFNYWIMPFIRIVGPIPSTAWIPIALVIFFKPTSA